MANEIIRQKESLIIYNDEDRYKKNTELSLTVFLLRFNDKEKLGLTNESVEIVYNRLRHEIRSLLEKEPIDKKLLTSLFESDYVVGLIKEETTSLENPQNVAA